MQKMKIMGFIFMFFGLIFSQLSFAQEGGMTSSKLYGEIISTAKQEGWKQCFLDADQDGNNVIKVRNFETGETLKIYKFSVNALADLRPAISNHGDKIGFWLKDGAGENSLYIVDADGSNLENITTIARGYWVLWYPDDDKIIFAGSSAKGGSLYIVDIRGKEVKSIINQPIDGITDQSLSPDGQKLLYTYKGEIYCYDLITNRPLKIASGDWFAWSPRGDWVAYLEEGEINIVNPNTLERRLLVKDRDISTPIYWLPNGEYIVYGVISPNAEIGDPYVVRLSDKKVEAIPDMSWMLASWSK